MNDTELMEQRKTIVFFLFHSTVATIIFWLPSHCLLSFILPVLSLPKISNFWDSLGVTWLLVVFIFLPMSGLITRIARKIRERERAKMTWPDRENV